MHAAVITGQNQVELREVPEPIPAARGIVVDIAYCGICGTDIHAFQSGRPYNPAVCGHEWAGTVSAVGAEVRDISEGDRVVVAVPPPCGRCAACRAGQGDRCLTVFASATGRDIKDPLHGGFAPRIGVAADRVVKVNAALSDLQAAQVEPATVGFHAVRRSGIRIGDVAVVQGAGPIGLTTLQWVKAAGAGELIVVEPDASRRRLAAELGATLTVGPDEAAPIVAERTNGLGADIVYECVGRGFAVQSAVDLARRGGTMCLIGVADTDATITPAMWVVKEIALVAALAYTHEEFEMAMGMIADGRIRLEPMHSATIGLGDLGEMLGALASGQSGQAKVLVDPRL